LLTSVFDGIYIKSMAATGATVAGRTLQVSAGQSVTLTVSLGEGTGRVAGVAMKDENPVAGAMLLLVPEDPGNNLSLFRLDQSDSDGTFTLLSVVPGKYRLLGIQGGWQLEWANPDVLRPYLSHAESVEVAPNSTHDLKVRVHPMVSSQN
jgi:hypothetical protein